MTWLLGKLYPITQNLFFEASATHDMAYHRGSLSGNRDFDREMADENFKWDCIDAVDTSRHPIVRIFKMWFFWQAEKYFLAVRLFGDSIYPRCSCAEKKQRMKDFP